MAGNEGEERAFQKVFSSLCTDRVQSFCGSVVRKDDVVRQALDKVLKELQEDIEDFDCEDPFADIVPEQGNDTQDSSPLEITDAD